MKIDPGTLFIVATPIGNLKDISMRAVETLREVDLIAAEDTRRAKVLLAKHDINTPATSFYSANQSLKTPKLIDKLLAAFLKLFSLLSCLLTESLTFDEV